MFGIGTNCGTEYLYSDRLGPTAQNGYELPAKSPVRAVSQDPESQDDPLRTRVQTLASVERRHTDPWRLSAEENPAGVVAVADGRL